MPSTIALILSNRSRGRVSETGEALASWAGLTDLNERLVDEGVKPLSHFVLMDAELLREMLEYSPDEHRAQLQAQLEQALQQPQWHDPVEGLRTIQVALRCLPVSPEGSAVAAELRRFEQVLHAANEKGCSFRLEAG